MTVLSRLADRVRDRRDRRRHAADVRRWSEQLVAQRNARVMTPPAFEPASALPPVAAAPAVTGRRTPWGSRPDPHTAPARRPAAVRACGARRGDGTACPNYAVPGSDRCGIPAHARS